MTLSLYDASVPTYLQTLDGLSAVLEKAHGWANDNGVDLAGLVEARLFEDMRPLRFQVHHAVFHSLGAVEAMRGGELHFPGQRPEHDFAGLQAHVADARERLRAIAPADIEALAGREVVFRPPGREMLFTTEGFLFSFSLPNFFFHATTAYDILRSRGAPLGKRDFMGPMRLKA